MPKGYRNVNVPKVDLSKYNSFDKLPISIEKILIEALIAFNANTSTVSSHFNIDEDKVSEVLIKYYSSISEIYQNNIKTKPMEDALNKSMEMMRKHISEVKSAQDNSDVKSLKSNEISNLCRMVDRISTVREAALKSYDLTINKLNANIAALKMTESKTEGKVEDDSDYQDNQKTVMQMLQDYNDKKKDKKVTCINIKTYEIKIFEGDTAKMDAEEFLGCQGHLSDVARQKSPYKGEWLITYEGKEPKYTNRDY